MNFEPDYAERLPYWKTSKSTAAGWTERTRMLIEKAGATIDGCGEVTRLGKVFFVISFAIAGDQFRAAWPVSESASGNKAAERRQAATMLFYDVKCKLVAAQVLGMRIAFLNWLSLPDGLTVEDKIIGGCLKLELTKLPLLPAV